MGKLKLKRIYQTFGVGDPDIRNKANIDSSEAIFIAPVGEKAMKEMHKNASERDEEIRSKDAKRLIIP